MTSVATMRRAGGGETVTERGAGERRAAGERTEARRPSSRRRSQGTGVGGGAAAMGRVRGGCQMEGGRSGSHLVGRRGRGGGDSVTVRKE
jgi:hypothetical protein